MVLNQEGSRLMSQSKAAKEAVMAKTSMKGAETLRIPAEVRSVSDPPSWLRDLFTK